MSVEAVKRLFSYNQWAWKRVFPSLETLPAEDYFAERPFFWDSLHGLAVHGYGAERAWLQRIGGNNPSRLVQPAEFDSFADLKAAWETLWDEWQAYVDALTASELDRKLQFRNTEGIEMYLRMDDVLRMFSITRQNIGARLHLRWRNWAIRLSRSTTPDLRMRRVDGSGGLGGRLFAVM